MLLCNVSFFPLSLFDELTTSENLLPPTRPSSTRPKTSDYKNYKRANTESQTPLVNTGLWADNFLYFTPYQDFLIEETSIRPYIA